MNIIDEKITANLMGPNCLRMIEETLPYVDIKSDMKILDLGCGKALTSIYLAEQHKVKVFANDLWIPPSENMERIKEYGVEDWVFPIKAEARSLPYADEFFDMIVSYGAYHYFGTDENYLNTYLLPLLKPNGYLVMATTGLVEEFEEGIPDNLKPYWNEKENTTFHSLEYWKKLWSKNQSLVIEKAWNLECHEQAWADWLSSKHIMARKDRKFWNADINKQLALIGLIAKKTVKKKEV